MYVLVGQEKKGFHLRFPPRFYSLISRTNLRLPWTLFDKSRRSGLLPAAHQSLPLREFGSLSLKPTLLVFTLSTYHSYSQSPNCTSHLPLLGGSLHNPQRPISNVQCPSWRAGSFAPLLQLSWCRLVDPDISTGRWMHSGSFREHWFGKTASGPQNLCSCWRLSLAHTGQHVLGSKGKEQSKGTEQSKRTEERSRAKEQRKGGKARTGEKTRAKEKSRAAASKRNDRNPKIWEQKTTKKEAKEQRRTHWGLSPRPSVYKTDALLGCTPTKTNEFVPEKDTIYRFNTSEPTIDLGDMLVFKMDHQLGISSGTPNSGTPFP